jgi:hypothetical protein
VGATIGSYLLALRAAEPADDDSPAVVLPAGQRLFGPVAMGHGHTVARVRDKAADRSSRKKPRG